MMKAVHDSINMEGMMEASEMPMGVRKLDEKAKNVLNKKNPLPLHHPTYLTMIKDAVLALNESKGVSKPALLKYLAQHYQLGENLPKINSHLCVAIRKALKDGFIEQTKGHGASGSFKLGKNAKSAVKRNVRTKHARKTAKVSPSVRTKKVTKVKTSSGAGKGVKLAKPLKASQSKKAAKTVKRKPKSATAKHRVQKKRGVTKSRAPRAKKA